MQEILKKLGCVRATFSTNSCGDKVAFVQGAEKLGYGNRWYWDTALDSWVPMF